MPRGRFSNKDRSTNAKYWKLDCETRNFWDLLYPWCDAEGRMSGDPAIIKGMVCPLAPWTVEQVEQMLKVLESIKRHDALGWIIRYNTHGIHSLWVTGFEENQVGLVKEREAKGRYGRSDIPPPPPKYTKMLANGGVKLHRKPKVRASETPVPDETSGTTEEKLTAELAQYWEELFKVMATSNLADHIHLWIKEYKVEDIKRAVDQAVKYKAKSPIPYIDRILATGDFNGSTKETKGTHGMKEAKG